MRDDLVAFVCKSFGWIGKVIVSPGPRGALGQIWLFETESIRFAVKEIFAEPPSEESILAELEFARTVGGCGIRVPQSHPDRQGRYLVTAPDGRWFRCFDWVDLRPVAVDDPTTPRRIGALLACLHRRAAASVVEPYGGGPPEPWYDHAPASEEWRALSLSGVVWAQRLCEQVNALQSVCAEVRPADPACLVTCNRDLHPKNVFDDHDGQFVLVDCEDLGPAAPARELARAVFDWCCTSKSADLDAVRSMIQGYLTNGGPGRVSELSDFSMLLASRLNFVLEQARLALDPDAEPRHRQWARYEVDSMRYLMPTLRQLTDVLAVARDCNHRVFAGPGAS